MKKEDLLKEEIDLLKTLTQDDVIIAGRKLSTYASAVLDLLGVEKYDGKDVDVKRFKSKGLSGIFCSFKFYIILIECYLRFDYNINYIKKYLVRISRI